MKNSLKTIYLLFIFTIICINGCKKNENSKSEGNSLESTQQKSLPDKFRLANYGLDVIKENGKFFLRSKGVSTPISEKEYQQITKIVSQYQVPSATNNSISKNALATTESYLDNPLDLTVVILQSIAVKILAPILENMVLFHPTTDGRYSLAGLGLLLPSLELQSTYDLKQRFINTDENTTIHALHYKRKVGPSKGLIFFLHGNAGENLTFKPAAEKYVQDSGYDLVMMDYRGFGLSTGTLTNKEELFNDTEIVYQEVSKEYVGVPIVVIGYSLGTGIAAHLVAETKTKPSGLTLLAPYYDMYSEALSILPILGLILNEQTKQYMNFNIETSKYLQKATIPVQIFHGKKDVTIPSIHSEMIKKENPNVVVTYLDDADHQSIFKYWTWSKKP
ncbi:alpha/beta hydrolase [Pedobacter nototheniae]|uniref:alpha/beta hydrolase n=1 Tax=Pedobacter nototheniae TaxID=2488994 RepID=UPI00104054A0|nr:alpha/beta fold hydrolase [Pedobacter nototheniae]